MYAVFDITIGKNPTSYVVFELFNKELPKTCANFAAFCTGQLSTPKQSLTYQGTKFHKIVKNFVAIGGDVLTNDGRGVISMYGPVFKDEGFKHKHDSRGLLTMVNSGPNTNGCQFMITFLPCPWLDRKNVVFGRVHEGANVVDLLESVATDNGVPKALAKVVSCGIALVQPENPSLLQQKPSKEGTKPQGKPDEQGEAEDVLPAQNEEEEGQQEYDGQDENEDRQISNKAKVFNDSKKSNDPKQPAQPADTKKNGAQPEQKQATQKQAQPEQKQATDPKKPAQAEQPVDPKKVGQQEQKQPLDTNKDQKPTDQKKVAEVEKKEQPKQDATQKVEQKQPVKEAVKEEVKQPDSKRQSQVNFQEQPKVEAKPAKK